MFWIPAWWLLLIAMIKKTLKVSILLNWWTLAPGPIGADVTIFNPDLDPDGKYAIHTVKIISEGLRYLRVMHMWFVLTVCKDRTDIPKEATFKTGTASRLGNGPRKTDWTVGDEEGTGTKVRISQSLTVGVCQTSLWLLNMFSAKNRMGERTQYGLPYIRLDG